MATDDASAASPLRYPWLRLDFIVLAALCRDPSLGEIAELSREFEYRLRAQAEWLIEDVPESDVSLIGFWCYDQAEVEHVRKLTTHLHAVMGDDWSQGALLPPGELAWETLADTAKQAYDAFAGRGVPPLQSGQ